MYWRLSASKIREPCAMLDEERRAADAAEGADRRVHAAGDDFLSALKESV